MRIVYCGNNERGYTCLEQMLADGRKVELVVAHPDPGSKPWYRSVKDLAQSRGIEVIQPARINAPESLQKIASVRPDVIILAGHSQIVKKDFLSIPRLACINLHGGRLPDYRGSSPINWMIVNGETRGGVSVIEVDEGIDTGPVLAEAEFEIDAFDTSWTVQQKTLRLFPPLLMHVLDDIEKGTVKRRPQDPTAGAYYPLRRPEDGLILWESMSARQVCNLVRALSAPYPCAFSFLGGRKVGIHKASLMDGDIRGMPGRIQFRRNGGYAVMCNDRCVLIEEVSIDGGEVLPAFSAPFRTGEEFVTSRGVIMRSQGRGS